MKSHLIDEDVRMANKHRVRSPRSSAIREIEVKTAMRYHYPALNS